MITVSAWSPVSMFRSHLGPRRHGTRWKERLGNEPALREEVTWNGQSITSLDSRLVRLFRSESRYR